MFLTKKLNDSEMSWFNQEIEIDTFRPGVDKIWNKWADPFDIEKQGTHFL